MYQPRRYRQHMNSTDLQSFFVCYQACDLWIAVEKQFYNPNLQILALDFIKSLWRELSDYLSQDEQFGKSLQPYQPATTAPTVAHALSTAGSQADVGPMAAVAGYFAQSVGEFLAVQTGTKNLIVENGGDIWLTTTQPRTVALYAGTSPLSNKIALKISPRTTCALCTSSGTVGHSLSFGQADAVTIIAENGATADAFATGIANRIHQPEDLSRELEQLNLRLLTGGIIIFREHIGAKGAVELVYL